MRTRKNNRQSFFNFSGHDGGTANTDRPEPHHGALARGQVPREARALPVSVHWLSNLTRVRSLLTVEVGLYLPAYKLVSVYWMKDLLAKRKKAIKAAQVQTLNVPQYESLSIKKMLDFAAAYAQIEDYFPDPREIPQLPRQVSQQVE